MNKKKVVIIDYGHGNLYSINQACIHLGYSPIISSDQKVILNADSLILPGVGAFKVAMDELANKNLIEPIKEFVKKGKNMMGVCLGMQLLFETSEEFGINNGLGLINGDVKKFPSTFNEKKIRIPQIGWNKIFEEKSLNKWRSTPLEEITEEDYMYFIHSYYANPSDTKDILSFSYYQDIKYCTSVQKENIFGFQFHPEKSAEKGLTIYKNFLKL
ncbi:imidazole glycerol phosphate synthase subunit HisH [Flavobacterium sp. ZB4P13]|uniref:imidazole glycerol phosphate synthase subunit HisH n=1 Tax=Flavobacterium sp. ZB4P13 TaxID=3401728 RepID=UPI003AAF76D5